MTTLDLTATIARAAGLDLKVLEGQSLLPRLVGDAATVARPTSVRALAKLPEGSHGELHSFWSPNPSPTPTPTPNPNPNPNPNPDPSPDPNQAGCSTSGRARVETPPCALATGSCGAAGNTIPHPYPTPTPTPTLTLTLPLPLTLTLTRSHHLELVYLFNITADPLELQNLVEKPTRAFTVLTLMNALDDWEADLPFAINCLQAADHGLKYVRTAAQPCSAPNVDPRFVVEHEATCFPGEMEGSDAIPERLDKLPRSLWKIAAAELRGQRGV